MKKALVTGILGQDGFYLTNHLLDNGYEVYGTARRNPAPNAPILRLIPAANLLYADMTNESQLYDAVLKSWPDEIYNLAGQTFPPSSWQYSWKVLDVNAGGFARLLELVTSVKPNTRIFQASTADMFGPVEGPCNENTPFYPGTPYGVSKLAAHNMAALWRKKGLWVSTCIMFNHDSPLRGLGFVTRKIVDHIVKHFGPGGVPEPIILGYLDGMRDWGYAGDYVKAMHLSLNCSWPDDFVIGTGVTHSVREFLDCVLTIMGIDRKNFYDNFVVSDPNLKRPNETKLMCADISKAKRVLSWEPQIDFAGMIADMTDSVLRRAQHERNRNEMYVLPETGKP